MDFSKLDQNEKLALYGSAALIIGGIVGYSYGITALGILAAIALLAIIFVPQVAPNTSLPGSKGSLMAAAGGTAGVAMVLALLTALDSVFSGMNFRDIFFLIAVAGGLLAAWAGWQAFQAEGGKWVFGSSSPARAEAPPAAAPAATAPVAAAPSEPPAATPPAATPAVDTPAAGTEAASDAPYRDDDEDRPTA